MTTSARNGILAGTVGAGDAFAAGVLLGLHEDVPMDVAPPMAFALLLPRSRIQPVRMASNRSPTVCTSSTNSVSARFSGDQITNEAFR
jgi:sugar/nucleoside kinase (ribokinase family)